MEQFFDSFTCFQIDVMMEVDPPDDNDESCIKEEDDPILKEVPVYLSKAVNCYMFQYPVRPASMTYDDSAVVKARFRPDNQQVQLEVRLNTQSENYDRSKGEQIALNTDGPGAGGGAEGKYFQARLMDKQIMMGYSVETRERRSSRYAVARMVEGSLHLTEVKGVLQLRPSLGYMDKSDKTARAEGRLRDADPDEPEEEERQPQAVTVKFSRVSRLSSGLTIRPSDYVSFQGDSDRAQKMKEKSYDYQMKRVEEEPWVECCYHGVASAKSAEMCQKLKCNNTTDLTISFNQSHKQYLEGLKDEHG